MTSPAEAVPLSAGEIRKTVLGAMMALFLSALDQTIVATALPSIGGDLGDFELIAWVVTAYLLTSTCATPVLGKLSDLYGRRPIMRLCVGVFLLGSVACALSTSMVALIASRALQGLGGGGLITMAQVVVADVVSPRERARYGAYFSSVWAGAALLGPTLGGGLAEFLSWHWIFWINLPLCALTLLIADPILGKLQRRRAAARIDYASVLLFSTATTGLLLALSWGGSGTGWLAPRVLVALLAAIVCGTGFVLRQRLSPEPILPPRFFADRVVRPILTAIFLVFGAYLAVVVLAPTYLQVALQLSTSRVGLLMIPVMLSTTFAAAASARYIGRTGLYRLPPLIGLPVAIAALLVLAWGAGHMGEIATTAAFFVAGLGIGPIFPVAQVAGQNAVERRDLGAVSGAISFSRALGGAVATAAGSSLVLGLIVAWLPQAGALAGLDDLVRRPLAEPERLEVARAFAVLYLASAGVLLAGLLAFLQVESRPLRTS